MGTLAPTRARPACGSPLHLPGSARSPMHERSHALPPDGLPRIAEAHRPAHRTRPHLARPVHLDGRDPSRIRLHYRRFARPRRLGRSAILPAARDGNGTTKRSPSPTPPSCSHPVIPDPPRRSPLHVENASKTHWTCFGNASAARRNPHASPLPPALRRTPAVQYIVPAPQAERIRARATGIRMAFTPPSGGRHVIDRRSTLHDAARRRGRHPAASRQRFRRRGRQSVLRQSARPACAAMVRASAPRPARGHAFPRCDAACETWHDDRRRRRRDLRCGAVFARHAVARGRALRSGRRRVSRRMDRRDDAQGRLHTHARARARARCDPSRDARVRDARRRACDGRFAGRRRARARRSRRRRHRARDGALAIGPLGRLRSDPRAPAVRRCAAAGAAPRVSGGRHRAKARRVTAAIGKEVRHASETGWKRRRRADAISAGAVSHRHPRNTSSRATADDHTAAAASTTSSTKRQRSSTLARGSSISR
ncbi:hypothetical protein BURPS1710b_1265 [Burkholderia pseudomallei 1710b]|uniref:Uncharacterized protein n=1 Tax=Burkholderia pseudomallei (strain 1710b) TaxID=320372 RepID=Q3JUS7_BURP1|nr:hypothetical protein BURPS1710b_1265 [Burkholderia pseudomallei 1710b]